MNNRLESYVGRIQQEVLILGDLKYLIKKALIMHMSLLYFILISIIVVIYMGIKV